MSARSGAIVRRALRYLPWVAFSALAAIPRWAAADEPRLTTPQSGIEVVRTHTVEVHISRSDALPVRWDLVDPLVLRGNRPEASGLPLISSVLIAGRAARPLALLTVDQPPVPPATERSEETDHVGLHFRWPVQTSGLELSRSYRIPRQGFAVELVLTFANRGSDQLEIEHQGRGPGLVLGPGLGQPAPSSGGLGGGLYSYARPVFRDASGVEILHPDAEEPEQSIARADGFRWAGLHSRYFAALMVPEPGSPRLIAGDSRLLPTAVEQGLIAEKELPLYPLVELYAEPFGLAPGEERQLHTRLYLGPKDRDALRAAGGGLDDLLFAGLWSWMRWLCFFLLSVLKAFHGVLHSWGLSIIALAAAVRVVTFPVAQVGLKQQARNTADQARLKPYIAEINEKYKDDARKKSEELMKLYKEHGINPFGAFKGCLWVVLQLPIFVALFNLLGQSFDLRGAGFLWISDLSEPDRLFPLGFDMPIIGSYFNILPLLMAATQVLVTQLSTPPAADAAESTQQKRMMFGLAVVFLLLFYSFPSGLVLYWMMANLGHLLQQSLLGLNAKRKAGSGS